MPPEHVVCALESCTLKDKLFKINCTTYFDHNVTKYPMYFTVDEDKTKKIAMKLFEVTKDELHVACAVARKHFHETQQKSLCGGLLDLKRLPDQLRE
jgi:hypothetical protein